MPKCAEIRGARGALNYTTQILGDPHVLPARHSYVVTTNATSRSLDILDSRRHVDQLRRHARTFAQLPGSRSDDQLRAQINNYFASRLGTEPSAKDYRAAAQETINRYPELIDYYIRLKEDDGDRAESVSASKVSDTHEVLVEQIKAVLADLETRTDFYDRSWTSYDGGA